MRAKTLLLPVLLFLAASNLVPGASRLWPTGGGVAHAANDTLKIYLLAGQSNMEGHGYTHQEGMDLFYNPGNNQYLDALEYLLNTPGYVSGLPAATYTFKNSLDASWLNPRDDAWAVHYNSGSGNMLEVKPTPSTESSQWAASIMPLGPGFGNTANNVSKFGPELGMGQYLGEQMQSPLFFFKSDRGGTRIDTDWRPPGAGGATGGDYTNTVNRFSEFLADLDADLAGDGMLNDYDEAVGYEVAGFVWLQGWNNRGDGQANREMYRDMLVTLTHDVRDLPRVPDDLPLIAVDHPQGQRFVDPGGTYSGADGTISQARREAVDLLNAEVPGSAVYVDLGPDLLHGYRWGYHWEGLAENYLEAGWRTGEAIIAGGYTGSEIVPEPGTISLLGTGGVLLLWLIWRRRGVG